jgi:aspartyl-tRNA(Asn)/glutamyl-tRNA(Gln) amidotransferase subunit A
MDNRELAFESVWGASRLLSSKRLSPVELTRVCLERIERLNPLLNAFITVAAESALNEARMAESEIQRGQYRGPLHGIPVALKDMIDTAGLRTTAASAHYANRVPQVDAEVVSRLRRAGAIVLGKLNMQEFAYGGTSVPSYFGPTRNPWNIECIAGGSSGGSAAAVASGLCFAALGTDTGGSIRQPAALCGIVGMKPSYGLVSNRGVIPLAASLDHVGPLTRTAEDCQLLLDAIAGYDAQEPSSEWHAPAVEPARSGLAGIRIGVARAFFFDGLHAEVASALEGALAALQSLGAHVHDVELEVSQDRTVFRAEAFAAHADALTHSSHLYQPETLAKLRLGASVDLRTYLAARRELKMQRRRIGEVFSSVDVLVSPTVPVPAPRLADYPSDFEGVLALEASSILRNTRPFNIFGIPALTVPCGWTESGLPIGLQLACARWRDSLALSVAHAYESTYHNRRVAPL